MALAVRSQRLKSIGKSLELYLEKVRNHAVMMDRERAEFEKGKRHLANIMGWDPHAEVSQSDINKAIGYLFPSGLTEKRARPVMESPDVIFPKMATLKFDDEGRPQDPLFFTLKPKFYALLSEIGLKTQRLNNYHDERLLKGFQLPENKDNFNLVGSMWLLKDDMAKKLGETLNDDLYANLILAFEHLAVSPLAHLESSFLMEYRVNLASGGKRELFGPQIPQVHIDVENNRRYAVGWGEVKSSRVHAKVFDAGTGVFTVNGVPLSGFQSIMARENLLAPLLIAEKFGQVDVEARIIHGPGGLAVIPRATRHAVALGIAALYPETKERLRLSGLLTQDPRKKERNKVNQPGARAKWIWKRR